MNPVGAMIDTLAEQQARRTPLTADQLRMFLAMVCKTGFDRMPLSVRHLGIPFYFAGYNEKHVFLSHAETCMVSQFSFDDLEPVYLDRVEAIQEGMLAWLDSPEGAEASALTNSAEMVTGRNSIPVTLCWPEGSHQREGILSFSSLAFDNEGTHWLCGIEVVEGQNVAFRYGLSRVASFEIADQAMIAKLRQGTSF